MKKIIIAESLRPLLVQDKNFLSRADIEVITAATNDDVLKIQIWEKAGLIITTFGLPGLSCEALFAMLHQSKELQSVFRLLICEDTPGFRERSSRCGAHAVMFKPVDPAVLARRVQELLDVPPRRSCRVILNVVIEGASRNRAFLCNSENISSSGMLISTEEPFAQGDVVSCSFYLPGGSKVIAHGTITRVVKQAPGSKMNRYGVAFTALCADVKTAIEAFINREVRNRPESSPGMDIGLVA
jgi:DNA-binding NarL/FixJ family response regulator